MAARMILAAVLLALVASPVLSQKAAPKPATPKPATPKPSPAGIYRYISVTKYNATAPLSMFLASEIKAMTNCKKIGAVVGVFIGLAANAQPKADTFDLAKIIELNTPAFNGSYAACDNANPDKTMIGSFVVAKARALFPVPAANMKFAAIPDKSVMHLGMSNVTNTATMITKRAALMAAFKSASVIEYLPGLSPYVAASPATAGYVPKDNLNYVNLIVTKDLQTANAYYAFKNGLPNAAGTNVAGMHPVYAEIKALQPQGGKDIEFVAQKI